MSSIAPSHSAQPRVYISWEGVINGDKDQTAGEYYETKQELAKACRLTSEIREQAKDQQWRAHAARISVVAFTHLLTHIACFAAACAPMFVTAFVILSPIATIALVAICIVIAVALQVIAHFFILKKENLSKLCTLMGIDELDKKANRMNERNAKIKLKISSLESKVSWSKLDAKAVWAKKKPKWDVMSQIRTKNPQDTFLQNLPAEVMAHITEYVIYTPLDELPKPSSSRP